MTGFDRLKEQMEGQEDVALNQTIDYLLTRKDMDSAYLKEDKTVAGMCDFIKKKGQKHLKNGWTYVADNVVYAWAIMYFSLPNAILKINDVPKTKNKTSTTENTKNNVISISEAKKELKKDMKEQLSLWGGDTK